MISDEEEWFSMRERYRKGISISQIARDDGHDRKTVRKYAQSSRPLERKKRQAQPSVLDPFKEEIKAKLAQLPFQAMKIFEDIQKEGYEGSYETVKKFIHLVKKDRPIQAELRYETEPGQQSQVDWIDFGKIELHGIAYHLYCFIMVLSFSRSRYAEYTFNCRTDTFIQCHMNAFQRFGGYTKTILYDNTKNVVLKRALKSSDSTWNPLFKDFFEHYGFTPRLCKPGIEGAKTKGKAERLVQYVERNFHMGLKIESLSQLNSGVLAWCLKADSKPHGTTHEIPAERLKDEGLMPLSAVRPFQIVLTERRKVSRDCFISYKTNLYSVPWKYAGREARLRIRENNMEVEIGGEVVCDHELAEGADRCIEKKEHFEGLYAMKLNRNKMKHIERMEQHREFQEVRSDIEPLASVVRVHERPLRVYDEFCIRGGPSQNDAEVGLSDALCNDNTLIDTTERFVVKQQFLVAPEASQTVDGDTGSPTTKIFKRQQTAMDGCVSNVAFLENETELLINQQVGLNCTCDVTHSLKTEDET